MNNYKKIKDISAELRPDEKFLEYGVEALSDAELLAIIIRSGSINERSVELTARILSSSKKSGGLLNIIHMTIDDLMKFKGIGKVKAIQIKAVAELALRISKKEAWSGKNFSNPTSVAKFYMEQLRHEDREHVIIMLLNTAGKLIKDFEVSVGTATSSLVSPREIFIEALKYNATKIILVHNHPGGNPSPSSEDIKCTKRVAEAGHLIGIELLDHIIIGDRKFVSIKEIGMMN